MLNYQSETDPKSADLFLNWQPTYTAGDVIVMSSLCVLWRGKRLHILRANCYCGSNRWLCVFGVTVSWCPNSESFNAQKIINYVSLIWLLDPLPATGIQPHMDLPLGWRDVFHTLSATTSMALWPIPWCWYYDSCIVIYGYIYIYMCVFPCLSSSAGTHKPWLSLRRTFNLGWFWGFASPSDDLFTRVTVILDYASILRLLDKLTTSERSGVEDHQWRLTDHLGPSDLYVRRL